MQLAGGRAPQRLPAGWPSRSVKTRAPLEPPARGPQFRARGPSRELTSTRDPSRSPLPPRHPVGPGGPPITDRGGPVSPCRGQGLHSPQPAVPTLPAAALRGRMAAQGAEAGPSRPPWPGLWAQMRVQGVTMGRMPDPEGSRWGARAAGKCRAGVSQRDPSREQGQIQGLLGDPSLGFPQGLS